MCKKLREYYTGDENAWKNVFSITFNCTLIGLKGYFNVQCNALHLAKFSVTNITKKN